MTEQTMDHDSLTVVQPKEVEQESMKFRMWCLGPFETIQKQPQFQENKGEWLLQEQERIVELAVGADTVTEFANVMGLGHMDQDTFLTAVRCYALRRELLADYAHRRFVLARVTDYEVVAAGEVDDRPTSPTGQGLSAQQVAELVQMLAATKLENERLKAAAIPRLTRQQLERPIAESLPYYWMQKLAVALKAYSATDANWDAHELPKAIWTVVHEELRNKRQGRTSHLPIPQNTGATATTGAPLGRVVRAPGGTAVVGGPQAGAQCYSCGQLGHWARQCPQAAVTGTLHQPHVQAKISQVGDQTILTSNKGWTFDLNGPPPANCRRCGQPHWEMFPCGAQGRVSLQPTATAEP